MDNRPIGIFDSGFGGISVLAAAVRLLPHEQFIYFGDNLHAPYGSLPEETIMAYTRSAIHFLTNSGCKAIVIACNTATSVAAAALRRELKLPIIAMEPALKPASMIAGDGLVLVLATEVTLKLPKFQHLMESYGKNAVPIPAPKLVPAVEAGIIDGPAMRAMLSAYLSPYLDRPVKAVVLGCTHFVFLKKALRSLLKQDILLIDGNEGTAKQLKKRLEQENLRSGAAPLPVWQCVAFHTAGEDADTLARMKAMLSMALDQLCD
ncbi:MAG TPA: glutamate racemase [Candidatus Limiplasma sp.]|nr:glutamate racemase [Candidatus Limiplasma sp.]